MDRIRIDFALEEGAILRILGLIERRGFRVTGIAMRQTDAGHPGGGEKAAMTIDIEARDPSRDIAVLLPQLHRLLEVRSVSLFTAQMASAA